MVYAIGFQSELLQRRSVWSEASPTAASGKIADETGGGYFELTKTRRAGADLHARRAGLHSQYVIGFAPTQLDGRVHKLAVRLKQPGLTARARRSYQAAPDTFSISEKWRSHGRGEMSGLSSRNFRVKSDEALQAARQALLAAGPTPGRFEVELQNGVLNLVFEEPTETKFVVSPNAPVRQIWVSAMARSYKLSWAPELGAFSR